MINKCICVSKRNQRRGKIDTGREVVPLPAPSLQANFHSPYRRLWHIFDIQMVARFQRAKRGKLRYWPSYYHLYPIVGYRERASTMTKRERRVEKKEEKKMETHEMQSRRGRGGNGRSDREGWRLFPVLAMKFLPKLLAARQSFTRTVTVSCLLFRSGLIVLNWYLCSETVNFSLFFHHRLHRFYIATSFYSFSHFHLYYRSFDLLFHSSF